MVSGETLPGRVRTLSMLEGKYVQPYPAGVLTWGFDYTWKVAGLEPWQLIFAGYETWHKAHIAYLDRHNTDFILYHGAGQGPDEPELLDETETHWVVRNSNNGITYTVDKIGLSVEHYDKPKAEVSENAFEIDSKDAVDARVGIFQGYSEGYRVGLRRLVEEVGDRALVIPYHCTAYISACYSFGFETAMQLMKTHPDLFTYACERSLVNEEQRMEELRTSGAEVILIADAWASCDIVSPEMVERFAYPFQEAGAKIAREHGLKVIYWNEGDIYPVLKLQSRLPVDAFMIEQPRKGVELRIDRVREAFGPGRCLMGNLDSEALLERNDPVEIAEAVYNQFRQSGRGAPFILNTGSPLPSSIEPTAVDAVMDAARSFRWEDQA